jgi:dienelactone hydrolase
VEEVDCGAYIREKIIFDSDPLSSVPAYALIPKDLQAPAPAVLCLHGHGPGKDATAGVTAADGRYSEEQKANNIQQHNCDYAHQLTRRGYITLTFDFRCFGERSDMSAPVRGHDRCDLQFMRGAILGINLLALHVHDTIRAIDYLDERPEVDSKRIGCAGLSFGGAMTMWAAALDKRIRAAVISGYFGQFESFAIEQAHICGAQFVPALRRYFDLADIAALIAPRPLLIQSGTTDPIFSVPSVKSAFADLKQAYEVWGAAKSLSHDLFEGGHRFNSGPAFAWFDKWLGSVQE